MDRASSTWRNRIGLQNLPPLPHRMVVGDATRRSLTSAMAKMSRVARQAGHSGRSAGGMTRAAKAGVSQWRLGASLGHPTAAARRRKPDRRRALELLVSCCDGCTEAILLAHGYTMEQMAELVRAGLAKAKTERVVAGSRVNSRNRC